MCKVKNQELFLKDIHLSIILMTSFHLMPISGFSIQSDPLVNAELGCLNLFDYSYDCYNYHYSYHNSHHQY